MGDNTRPRTTPRRPCRRRAHGHDDGFSPRRFASDQRVSRPALPTRRTDDRRDRAAVDVEALVGDAERGASRSPAPRTLRSSPKIEVVDGLRCVAGVSAPRRPARCPSRRARSRRPRTRGTRRVARARDARFHSLITTHAAAPSEKGLALPAATCRPGTAGLIAATAFERRIRVECLVRCDGDLARRQRAGPRSVMPIVTVIGASRRAKRPAACRGRAVAGCARRTVCGRADRIAACNRLRRLEHRQLTGLVLGEPRLAAHVLVSSRSGRTRSIDDAGDE